MDNVHGVLSSNQELSEKKQLDQIKQLENIMSEVKLYLTTHHENTSSVNHYKTNGVKIALNLCETIDNVHRGQIMLSYLETMSGKGTGGMPDLIMKIDSQKQSIAYHFCDILKDFIEDRDGEKAKRKLDLILSALIGNGKEVFSKTILDQTGEEKIIEKTKYDKNNWLYGLVKKNIHGLDVATKESLGKQLIGESLEGREHIDYVGYVESKITNEEYVSQREIMRNIFMYAFLDSIEHIKDVIRSGHDKNLLSDSEIKSIVLASFQNGVLTSASDMYPEIMELHQSVMKEKSNIFSPNYELIQLVHIPLSSYTKLPKSLSNAWSYILSTELLGDEFLKFIISKRLAVSNKKGIQAGFVRFEGKKQPLFVGLENGDYVRKVDHTHYLTWEEGLQLISFGKINNHHNGPVDMLVYQEIFDFVPMLLGGVYHIGSERGIRDSISDILNEWLQKHNIDETEKTILTNNILEKRIVGDEPEIPACYELVRKYKEEVENTLKPVAISNLAPSLNEIVLNRYPRELVAATLNDSSGYHIPTELQKNTWLMERHSSK